jgi:S-adenosylmethionine:tRNA ribosyltransferase-isomerase
MNLSEFDYELPAELIAKYPTAERRASRMLVVDPRHRPAFNDSSFAELPAYLRAGDLLVFNDTRVIRARLHGRKDSGGRVEILLERVLAGNEAIAQIRASKSPKPGTTIELAGDCTATVLGRENDMFTLQFSIPVEPFLQQYGDVPLPPYLDRHAESADSERYQTIYARSPGAVAAPTAGLHFDERMFEETENLGVRHAYVTLHVGAGTFQSLRQEHIESNRLHAERLHVGKDVCAAVRETRAAGGRVIAVGTTSVRALEAASADGEINPFSGETDLFILPGYKFRSVDVMLTNFHLPQSSLLMLVAAFAGSEIVRDAYSHAVEQRYRFFSYGDAMLIQPQPK